MDYMPSFFATYSSVELEARRLKEQVCGSERRLSINQCQKSLIFKVKYANIYKYYKRESNNLFNDR